MFRVEHMLEACWCSSWSNKLEVHVGVAASCGGGVEELLASLEKVIVKQV